MSGKKALTWQRWGERVSWQRDSMGRGAVAGEPGQRKGFGCHSGGEGGAGKS